MNSAVEFEIMTSAIWGFMYRNKTIACCNCQVRVQVRHKDSSTVVVLHSHKHVCLETCEVVFL